MWWWRDQLTGPDGRTVDVGFTDAAGGVSAGGPIGSLNLGGKVGDDPSNVVRNRDAVAAAVDVAPADLIFMRQTHSDRVVSIDDGDRDPDSDGIVTSSSGVALAVLVADCTPVLLADPAAGVIGAVHAGRPGMMARIVDNALDRMGERGATNPVAIIGPSVCSRCYEVPLEMREEAAAVSPESRTVSWTGTPAIDVAGGVVAQLHARGVATTWVPGCTREDDRLYSYRRDHRSGRFAGVIVQRGGPA